MGVAKYTKDQKGRITDVLLQSGIHVKPVYGPVDLERIGLAYERDLGDPGEYPFTRGIHPQGYRSRAWTTRQYTGFGTPSETNERFKLMISHGQTGLNVAFDLPTQMGYDSDDPMSEGEVGRVGMAIDSLRSNLRMLSRVKPSVRNTATSRVRSRIDIAMVLAQTSSVVKTTAPQMLRMNALTLPRVAIQSSLKACSLSLLVGIGVP